MKYTLLFLFILFSRCVFSQNFSALKKVEDVEIDGRKFTAYEGQIEVPENYSMPDSRQLQLPVFVVKSSGSNPNEPIFWLDGGPGGSNIISRNKINISSAANVLTNHDLVCVGYRGVDGSTVLASKKISKAFKGQGSKLLSQKSINHIDKNIKKYNHELKEKGIDISNYNILNVIEDMEVARKKMSYEKINLFSLSYGTRIALLYSYKYPDVIKRALMIGTCPPGFFLARPEQAETILNKYEVLYKQRSDSLNIPALKEMMKMAYAKMPKRWSVFKLDADKIKAGTVNALYNVNLSVAAFDAYKDAAMSNDYSGLFMLQKLSDISTPKIIGDIYAKTVSADWGNENFSKLPEAQTVLGSNVAKLYGETAQSWEIQTIPKEYQESRISSTETLIISGELDHRTPAYIVDSELMPYLTNGKHIVLKNSSHTEVMGNVMKSPTFIECFFDGKPFSETDIPVNLKIDFNPKIKIKKRMIFLMGLFK